MRVASSLRRWPTSADARAGKGSLPEGTATADNARRSEAGERIAVTFHGSSPRSVSVSDLEKLAGKVDLPPCAKPTRIAEGQNPAQLTPRLWTPTRHPAASVCEPATVARQ